MAIAWHNRDGHLWAATELASTALLTAESIEPLEGEQLEHQHFLPPNGSVLLYPQPEPNALSDVSAYARPAR